MLTIKILHYKQCIENNDDWIYLGNSFLKFHSTQKKFSKKNINLSYDIHQYAKDNLKNFLIWNDNERMNYKDNLYWWMSHHNSRNNFVSKFYLQLCQVYAVINYINNSKIKSITIVCEDIFILKTINQNLKKFSTRTFFYLHHLLYDYSKLILTAFYVKAIELVEIIKHIYYSRLTKTHKNIYLNGNVVLIHNCLDIDSFKTNPISYRFFNKLPYWLQSRDLQVFSLPWFYTNNINLREAYLKIRKENYFIPDDWLRIHEYIYIFFKSIIPFLYIKNKNKFENIEIKYLIQKEQLLHLNSTSANFWKYNYAIKRWAKNIESLTLISEYENNIFEHTLRYSIKQLPIKTKTIGYFHSLLSNEFLAHHTLNNEWESKIKPDKIICMGVLSYDFLIKQGTPKQKLVIGPALRQDISIYDKIIKTQKNSDEILVLLSLSNDINIELLSAILKINTLLEKRFKIRLKPHPLMDFKSILKLLNLTRLPSNWFIDDGALISILSKSTFCIAMSTASVYDAILCGIKVLPISSKFNIMDNYLDIFNDLFISTIAIDADLLYEKILELNNDVDNKFKSQFNELRSLLINGINPINELYFNRFLTEINSYD